jgi:nucleoid DNA-binding protein
MPESLTKFEIIKEVASAHKLEFTKAREIVQLVFDIMLKALTEGRKIELRNFGVFEIVERKGRPAQNIKAKTQVYIPPRKIVKFRQGLEMYKRITQTSMQQTGSQEI